MMLIVLVCASNRCGNNIKPVSSRKVFKGFQKVLKAKKFLDLAQHGLDIYSGSRIRRHLRGVWLTLDYICYLFWTTHETNNCPGYRANQLIDIKHFTNQDGFTRTNLCES